MAKEVATVQDRKGDTWTGTVTKVDNHHFEDGMSAALSCGLSLLGGRSEPTVTVVVNGEAHSGRKV